MREPHSELAHRNPTRRISNETQPHVDHRVAALDLPHDASLATIPSTPGPGRPKQGAQPSLRCPSWPSGCTERWCSANGGPGTSSCSVGSLLALGMPSCTRWSGGFFSGAIAKSTQPSFSLDVSRARRDWVVRPRPWRCAYCGIRNGAKPQAKRSGREVGASALKMNAQKPHL